MKDNYSNAPLYHSKITDNKRMRGIATNIDVRNQAEKCSDVPHEKTMTVPVNNSRMF